MTRNCFEQLNTRDQIVELYDILTGYTGEKDTVILGIAASSSGSIPVGTNAWSLYVSGANATIDGAAVATGTSLSGVGPVKTAIPITTGLTTTVTVVMNTVA